MTRRFLFLQGPISPFLREVAAGLAARGHAVHRINLNLGDWVLWRGGPGDFVNYRGTPEAWPGFVARYLDDRGITDLVLLGEQRPMHRVAIAAAQARGIAVTVTDFGYLRPDWITLERDGMNGESRFPRDPAAILALADGLPPVDLAPRYSDSFRAMAAWDVAYHLAGLVPLLWPHERHGVNHPLAYYAGIGWRLLRRRADNARADREAARAAASARNAGGGRIFLFAMQMETDYSIRAYSPYRDLDTPIREVVESFAAHAPIDARLLIKVHPLDPGLKRWGARVRAIAARAGASDRVHYLGGGALRDLTERMDGVVTVNSTVGLRAIVDGVPALALGQAVYRVPGLTHEDGLDRFWTAPTRADPALREAFLRALAWSVQVRGVFYARPGLDAGVAATVERLDRGAVNVPVVAGGDTPPQG